MDTLTPQRRAPLNNGPVLRATLPELIARAQALMVPGERRILGITGAPGAGKSTVCAGLADALGAGAVVVGMDGFHLANRELERLGRRQRKGAPDTFDMGGYAALLQHLRAPDGQTIYTPVFDRQLEESIGSAVPVPPQTPLIITEGNYLLLEGGGWERVAAALDEVWFLDLPDELRLPRLLRRHEQFGRSPEEAGRWVDAVDQRNAELIGRTRERADLIVQLIA
ncbi:nucleoside/nucleotide kinase family protein [Deinococcus sp.]|uniref:nucleoside/nucleotide kinase family protein n=1 Tax=Deinococcus sp. TaxID=47478 RepID=UPI003CC6D98B